MVGLWRITERSEADERLQASLIGRIACANPFYTQFKREAAPQIEGTDCGSKMDVGSVAAARARRDLREVVLDFAFCARGDSLVGERHFHSKALRGRAA
ncbi:hypothetical protein AI46_27015 [Burkholderia multivorans R-20526]|nr:hypothetical protein AI46_27015 [Burkholderia multivorans R-20526]